MTDSNRLEYIAADKFTSPGPNPALLTATEYSDYAPNMVLSDSEYKEAVKVGRKKTKMLPPGVVEVRFKWPDNT